MTETNSDIEQRRSKGKRTAILLGLLALVFYAGFFLVNLKLS